MILLSIFWKFFWSNILYELHSQELASVQLGHVPVPEHSEGSDGFGCKNAKKKGPDGAGRNISPSWFQQFEEHCDLNGSRFTS